ncbi:MAG: tRNA-dihydrouridine synthase family protein [Parabacteroides sp.]|nr:tRNA-dihydrouridine synthase family protein [Parabacteroides sp.]
MAVIHFAPLQGYTDSVYREAHARIFGGVDAYYTPFVRIEKGGFRNKDLRDIARDGSERAHVVPQLIASTPDEFRLIARLFQEHGYREADINLGCPFPMQVRAHRGSGLLPYPEEAGSLLRTIEEFPDISFSVKTRLGWERADESFALLSLLNKLPLKHITLHPRLGIQQYKGAIDWEGFARFYEGCELPLYYNGDVAGLEAIRGVKERFPGLAGIMLGRGLLASPWLAAECVSGQLLTADERRDKLVLFHASLMDEYAARLEGGEHQLLAKMKTIWDYLLPEADKRLRKKVLKSASLTSYQSAVKELLSL